MAEGGVTEKTQALPRACMCAQPESRLSATSWDTGPSHQATVGGAGRRMGGSSRPGSLLLQAFSLRGTGWGWAEVGCHSHLSCHFHQMSRGLFTRLQPLCPVPGAIYKALNGTAQERAPGALRNSTVASLSLCCPPPHIKHDPCDQPTSLSSLGTAPIPK